MNYESMSKEELIRVILGQNDELEQIQKDNEQKKLEIEKLQAEKKQMNLRIEELLKKYEEKVEESRRIRAERFIPKTEKLKTKFVVINEADKIEDTKNSEIKRRTPNERFLEDIKKLCREEDITVLDYDFDGAGIKKELVKEFGEDESYKIEIEPVGIRVKKTVRLKYKDKDHIYQAMVEDVFPHSVLTPSLAANIIEAKYVLGVPLYRYAQYFQRNGFKLTQQDLSNYVARATELLEPIYETMKQELIHNSANVIHVDETPLKVLDSKKSKSYMFVYTTSFWDHTIYIYDFQDTRRTQSTKTMLNEYHGYIICDGYSGYDSLVDQWIKIQRCFVHCRRYFAKVVKGLDEETAKKSPAYEVLCQMQKIFYEEKKYREKEYRASQIKEARNSESYKKIIEDLDKKINDIDVGNNEMLGKAVSYYDNQKKELYTYLEDGHVDLTNNLAERVVRPFTICRKNFMFCKSINGAGITGKVFSIVQTARANGLNSEAYVRYVLENIEKMDLKDLLPWSEKIPEHVKIKVK